MTDSADSAVRTVGVFPLMYEGITPIATCHWQWVGNVLASRGHPGFWERLGLSWGFRWFGGPVLFGSGRWPLVAREAIGLEVSIRTCPSLEDALADEHEILSSGCALIVEVDEFHLPRYEDPAHVVHAVLVVSENDSDVYFVDSRINGDVVAVDRDRYGRMRSSACEGRVESFKLYAIGPGPTQEPGPGELLRDVRADLELSLPDSNCAAIRYLEHIGSEETPIDVCRAAGERFQAARLFEHLSAAQVPGCDQFAEQFRSLSERWYFVHMLSVHERAGEARNIQRLRKLMEDLVAADIAATQEVVGV